MGAPLRNHWCTNEVGLFDHLPFEQLSVLSTTALPPIDGAVCETGDAGTPVPLSATRCGLLAALLEISSVAVLAPLERGRKATPIAHVAPGGTKIDDGEQWSLMRTKSSRLEPVMVARGPIVCGPLLVSVTVCVPLCVPDRWLPKLSDVGLIEAVGGVAVPPVVPASRTSTPSSAGELKIGTAMSWRPSLLRSPAAGFPGWPPSVIAGWAVSAPLPLLRKTTIWLASKFASATSSTPSLLKSSTA